MGIRGIDKGCKIVVEVILEIIIKIYKQKIAKIGIVKYTIIEEWWLWILLMNELKN